MCDDLVVIAIVAVVVKVVVTVNVLCIVVLSSNDLWLRVLFACIRHLKYYSHKSNQRIKEAQSQKMAKNMSSWHVVISCHILRPKKLDLQVSAKLSEAKSET